MVTDTRPTADIAGLVAGVDLLVCEATYGRDEDQARAVERGHMTFREAAALALSAGAFVAGLDGLAFRPEKASSGGPGRAVVDAAFRSRSQAPM